MRPATSHDVARLAGVSQPTVSRALRDDPRVSPETIVRVRAAAEQLGYVPSSRGRSLSTRATGQIAVVVGELDNPFYMEALGHLYGCLETAGLRLVALTDPPERSSLTGERLLDGAVDGAIVMTTLLGSELPGELAARGLPTVLLNRAVDAPAVDVVECDNAQGSTLAAERLLALGHREIAAICGPATTSTGRDREAAFTAALAAAGVALPAARLRRGPFTHAFGHRALGELLAAPGPRPTAVFCANDVLAIGALNAAKGAGVAVPAELTVLGFDDIATAAWELYDLSTVRQPLAEMAAAAVRLLTERIADPARTPQRLRLPAELVSRGSDAAPPLTRAPSPSSRRR